MSYTFLQEQGEESSAGCFSDIEPFVRSKLNLTAEKSSCNDSETASCRGSRSGTMCEPSTESRGEELQTLCAEASPAKILVLPETGQESQENDQDCGQNLHGSLAKYDPITHSLKTHQCLLFADSMQLCLTLPDWGMMRDGVLWEQTTRVRPTEESESGYWLTPTVFQVVGGKDRREKRTKYRASVGRKDTPGCLAEQVNNPQMWPTPTRRDYKGARLPETMEKTGRNADTNSLPDAVEHRGEPGRLNPTWVEWLMGWPTGWSALKPLGMDSVVLWQQQHGIF